MNQNIPPIWVINLKRSPQRKETMRTMLDALGLKYEFVDATDGAALSQEDLKKYSAWKTWIREGRGLSKNEIGCALSHYWCLKRLIEEQHDEVIIMEDDINFGQDFLEVIKRRKESVIEFDRINFMTDISERLMFKVGKPCYKNYYFSVLADFSNRTSCYLITYQGAKKLLKNYLPISLPADGLMGYYVKKNFLLGGVYPPIVHLNDIESDIWPNEKPFGQHTLSEKLSHHLIAKYSPIKWMNRPFLKIRKIIIKHRARKIQSNANRHISS